MASPGAGLEHLTFTYTENDDGWITAQIVEYPAAISQGPTREQAKLNALEALHDLTHKPTLAERVAFAVQARATDLSDLVAELGELRDRFIARAVERARAAADRDRTGIH